MLVTPTPGCLLTATRYPVSLEGDAANNVTGGIIVGIGAIDQGGKSRNVLKGGQLQSIHLVDAVDLSRGETIAVAL
ncbi:hypothetical protein HYQ46_001442 [Verticillium longisporum]|nr:hypothetical protein HYQ46_001442 [Verticillium longisporum]